MGDDFPGASRVIALILIFYFIPTYYQYFTATTLDSVNSDYDYLVSGLTNEPHCF